MEANNNIENLNELKKDYDRGLVSALIGAGFSKNVSSLYLDWTSLLEDLIDDIFKLEINQYIGNYFHCNVEKYHEDEKKQIKKEFVDNLLSKYGYLGIVSKYVDQKGYREVLENYIEERTPYVKRNDDGTISLYIKDKKKSNIIESDFSAHKQLLRCDKFKNIYTTNYDNLLEFTSDNFSETQTPVVDTSWNLSNGFQKRSIIKIHGSLSIEDDRFEFDGDQHLRYIIAQEDYDTYIEKHEAFSHLMRISMLQGKFCLLGFSGNDPNYMGWVKWMSDILGKGKDKGPKIYLVTFKNEESSDKKLYYKNHYIREINLMEVLSLLGYDQSERDKLSLSAPSSYKEILESFLKFLCKTEKEVLKETDGKANSSYERTLVTSTESKTEKVEITTSEKNISFEYKELWNEASLKFNRQENLSEISERIKKAKTKYPFCKVVYNQERFIETALRRKGDLTEPEAYLFALAVKETGQLPSYFSKFLQDKPILDLIPLWKLMIQRGETLKGSTELLQLSNPPDDIIYENIQRELFHLEFEKAHKLLEDWDAKGYWLQAKAMRLAAFYGSEKAFGILSSYIDSLDNAQEKMFACVLANYISLMVPRPYNLDYFLQNNIYGQGKIISYILEEMRGKEDKPKQRGWVGSSYSLGFNNTLYEQSLRFLQFIFDTGLYLNFGITYFVNIKDWYKVCKNLFKFYPYPCFFYSIQYHDKDVLRRIGQDYAFTPDLLEENKDLLLSSLKAYRSQCTPETFLSGILNITGPLYLCVDESIWFDSFKTNIFDFMITHISEYTHSDIVVENVENAVSCLKSKRHLEIILGTLLQHAKDNMDIVQRVICSDMNLKYLDEELNEGISNLLEELICVYPQIDITEVVYSLNINKCLPDRLLKLFMTKLKEVGFDDIPSEIGSLFYICILAKADEEIIKKAKQKILEKDIWHCGVLAEGNGWSTPNYIRLQAFKDITEWDDQEFSIISNNLRKNISKYNTLSEKFRNDSFMRNVQITYLSDVLQYINTLSKERRKSLEDLRVLTKNLLSSSVSYDSFIEAMLSEQSADVSNGIDNIVQGIRSSGLESYHNEINFIVDRAIIGEQIVLSKNLSVIEWLIRYYEQDFKEMQIDSKLLVLLSVYKNRWQDMDEFRPDYSFEDLYNIASYLKKEGHDNDSIQYWLTDSFVQIFL
ncbi:MAG: SIR2 family protein [Prevotella histicola]|uniref:SIR2 family protein n=1 Tax=Prevotella histicola TaxID=470565 RepID=A0A930HY70_9BACT|nr:SIR2 family protein [Prevotella histicola]